MEIKGVIIDDVTYNFEDNYARSSVKALENTIAAGDDAVLNKAQTYFEKVNNGFVIDVVAPNCTVEFYKENKFLIKCVEGDKINHSRTKAAAMSIPCDVVALEPQVNFTVVPNEGFVIDDNDIRFQTVEGVECAIANVVNQIKTPSGGYKVYNTPVLKDSTGEGSCRYSITKIKSACKVVFTVKEAQPELTPTEPEQPSE